MRLATGIISLFLMLFIGIQSCTINTGASMTGNEELSVASSVGLFVAILFLIGGAFSFKIPKVSMYFFLVATIVSLLIGFNTAFTDMKIWGFVAFMLATLSFFAREKRNINEKSAHLRS